MKTYFIQSGGRGGPIKIGSSERPRKRLLQLQCGNPEQLTLLAHVEGDYEKTFHELLSEHRITGEWFSHSIVAKLVRLFNLKGLRLVLPLRDILREFSKHGLVKLTLRPREQSEEFGVAEVFESFSYLFTGSSEEATDE